MKDRFPQSKEMLNAFVDDELDEKERQDIINDQVEDQTLAETICEIRIIKDMVRAARPNSEMIKINASVPPQHYFGKWFVAASLVMVLFSFSASTVLDINSETVIAYSKPASYSDVSDLIYAQQEPQVLKLVLHLTVSDDKAAMKLFNQIDELLEYSNANSRHVQVQVVASGQGVRILQQGESRYQDRIKQISTQYDSIEFVACQRSMSKLANNKNLAIRIVPEVLVTNSGPDLIKRRQKQGWATIII